MNSMHRLLQSISSSSPHPAPGGGSRPFGSPMTAMVLMALVAGLLMVGCQSPSFTQTPADAATPQGDNRLKEGDVVQLVFPGATNLNTVQKIPLDGELKLQFVGPVPAAGKTPVELQTEVLKSYGSQLQVKEVTVTLIASSATIYLSGAVLRPGRIPLERPMTVMEAVMEAGGFDPNRAKLSQVTVIRNEKGKQVNYRVDLKKVLSGHDPKPFYVKPFDIIHVPVKTFNL